MSRKKFWAYLRDEQGQPIPSASIQFKLNNGTLARIYSTSVSAANDEIDQSTLTTDVSGFFEFFIGDVYEQGTNRVGYNPDQLFRLEWTSANGRKSGYIDDMQMFYQVFPVDENDPVNTIKNKLASNELTYSWDTHRQQTWFFEVHGMTAVDKNDSTSFTYNHLVSNKFMNDLKLDLEALQISGGESLTIEASGAVARGFDIPSGSWSIDPSGSDLYYYDVNHQFNTLYPLVQMWCTNISCMQYPAKIEFRDVDTTRIYVTSNERDGKHIVAISESNIGTELTQQNPIFEADLQTLNLTQFPADTNIVIASTVSAGLLSLSKSIYGTTYTLGASPTTSLLTLDTETHSITLTGDIIASGAPLPQGIIIPLYDYQSPLPAMPTGWKLFSIEGSGGSYVRGTSTEPLTYVEGDTGVSEGIVTASAGEHQYILSNFYTVDDDDGGSLIRGYTGLPDKSAGLHTHTLSGFDYRPEFQNLVLIQATKDNKKIPQQGMIFTLDPRSINGSIYNNMSQYYSQGRLFRYKNEFKGPEAIGTSAVSAGGDDSITGVVATSAGLHHHGTGDLVLRSDSYFGGMSNTTYSVLESGLHWDNNVQITPTPYMKRKILSIFRAASSEVSPSGGMIAMWPSTVPPFGWELCNGNNNTPDLTDHFIEFDAPYFESNEEFGDDTVDFYINAMHYWGGNGITPGEYHGHRGNKSYTINSFDTIIYYHRDNDSSGNTHYHQSTINMPFTPPHIKLVFIRKIDALYVPPRTTSYVTDTHFTTGIDWDESYQTGGSASVSGGILTILSGEGTIDHATNTFDGSGIYQSGLVDNFDVVIKVIKPDTVSDKLAFMIYVDENNYAGLVQKAGETSLYYIRRINGTLGYTGNVYFTITSLDEYYVRLKRERGYITLYTSQDNESWNQEAQYTYWPIEPVDIWVSVNDNGGTQYSVELDWIVNYGQIVDVDVDAVPVTVTVHPVTIGNTPPEHYIPENGIIMYYGPSAAIPDNWESYRQYLDEDYANRILKGWNGNYSDIENRSGNSEPTFSLPITGAHTGSTTFESYSHNLEISYATIYHGSSGELAGNHGHTATITNTNPELMNVRLIKALNYRGIVPPSGAIFGDKSDIIGLTEIQTNQTYPMHTYRVSAGSITPSAGNAIMSVGESGYHSHHDEGDVRGDAGGATAYPYENPADHNHTHTINWSETPNIYWNMRRKYVQAFKAVTETLVPSSSSIIVGWEESSAPPSGWSYCDGTNGTIDLRDYFICCDSTETFGTSAGDNTIDLPAYTTNSVGHQHRNTSSSTPLYKSWPAYHLDVVYHSHAGSAQTINAQYEYIKLAFIQKVG